MSYNSQTKKITAPVSIYDLQQCFKVVLKKDGVYKQSNDLGVLASLKVGETVDGWEVASREDVNPWAKCKPIKAPFVRPLDTAANEQANYGFGLKVLKASTAQALATALQSAYNDNNYKYKGVFTGVEYDRPVGGETSPYRLTDFDGYDHAAYLLAALDDQSGNSYFIVATYGQQIDLTASVLEDKALPDDSAALRVYDNFYLTDGTRETLTILDPVAHANTAAGSVISQALSGFRRGVILSTIYNGTIGNSSAFTGSIPWRTDSSLASTYGSRRGDGADVLVSEFYSNANGTMFYLIPEMTYISKCKLRWLFGGYTNIDPNTNKAEIFVSVDANPDDFHSLWFDFQLKVTENDDWETVRRYRIKDSGQAAAEYDVVTNWNGGTSVIENVYDMSSVPTYSGIRLRVCGSTTTYGTQDYYVSEE